MKKRVLFIVNPVAGGKDKRKILHLIERRLERSLFECEVAETRYPGHAIELARGSGADVAVAVGGDGTVSEVAQGVAGSRTALGILPCGSGDGLALHLGISRNPLKALEVLNGMCRAAMDCGEICGRPFFCTAGAGLDALVASEFAKDAHRGLRTYISKAWQTWRHFHPESYTIDIDGSRWRGRAVLVTAGNANQWGNRAYITPKASVSDGLLDVTVVEPFHTAEIPCLAAMLLTGQAGRSRRTRCFRGSHIIIRREAPGPVHYDGDPCEMGRDLDIRIVPHALEVVIPPERKI